MDLGHALINAYVYHKGCESCHLPEHLAPHVKFVTLTVHFDAKIFKRSGDSRPALSLGLPTDGNGPKVTGQISTWINELLDCDKYITPICLRALYGLIYEPLSKNNSYGIVEYTPQSYRQSDLDMFARNISSDLVGVSPVWTSIDGGELVLYTRGTQHIAFGINGESDLDLEYGMNLVTSNQTVTLYQVGDMVQGASFNNFLDAIDGTYCTYKGGDDPTQDGVCPDSQPGGYTGKEDCGTVKPANVISTYGYNESDLTPSYAQRQCDEYAKLGLMGVTVLYSSGDSGVSGNRDLCLNPNGTQTKGGNIFNPSFPSTCPYVTSVGATQVSPGKTIFDSEDACEQVIYSGGGFANYFAMPEYQKTAVTSYLKNYPPQYPSDI